MKGISRRARTCAVVAATGVAVLAQLRRRAGAAPRKHGRRSARRSDRHADVQFQPVHHRHARRAEGEGRGDLRDAAVQGHPRRGAVQPPRHDGRASSARSPTSTTSTSSAVTAASPRRRGTARSRRPRRSASSSSAPAAPPLPGQGTYAQTLATAATLNRLGKRSVEAGAGKVYIHNHTDEFTVKYDVNGTLKSAWEILMDNTDAALRRGRGRRRLGLRRAGGRRRPAQRAIRPRIEMMHVKDLTNIAPPGRSGQPGAARHG